MFPKELKEIPIADFLRRLGYAPVSQRGRELTYFAPYRDEHTPSFRVNTEKNLFYDFGTGRGGDIFKLAGELALTSDFREQAKYIAEAMCVQLPMKENPLPFRQSTSAAYEDVEVRELDNNYLLLYLANRGINAEIAKRYCEEVHYRRNGKERYAIGFKNVAGGYELRNKFWKGTVAPKDVSLLPGNDHCNVFEGFIDFLSAVQMGLHTDQSAIVLNSVANVQRALHHLEEYAEIACYLDNDEAGRNALNVLKELYSDTVVDRSALYQGFNDVNDWLMASSQKKSNKLKL